MMSTYNGERFLREQIDSIRAQRDVDVTLVIRDDVSHDSTPEIIAEAAQGRDDIKKAVNGENGPRKELYKYALSVFLTTMGIPPITTLSRIRMMSGCRISSLSPCLRSRHCPPDVPDFTAPIR